ncbi:MAG: hypothetical protein Q4B84_03300 [Clostridia bacterium]|nr:hypothetical protein [Clostridia bacterium]
MPQQLETITQGQNKHVEDSKSPKPPKSTQTNETKRRKCKNPDCPTYGKGEKRAKPYGQPYTRRTDGIQMQQYKCKKCKKTFVQPIFTQPINKNAEEQAGIETQPN